ncbi:MAG: T9SS type A sorting domain-containing protein [Candidatus Aegiribacteria sp.]|nr:T9SS type A sorting domain-containing protein [Candidatus Aegiribacteria sp.]
MDWNNDGRLDIIVGDRLGSVNYFRRLASGNIFLIGESPVKVAGRPIEMGHNSAPCVIDWNNDGLPDLVVGRVEAVPAGLYLYINEGSPSDPVFPLTDSVLCAGEPIQVYYSYPDFADMNGDGLLDLVLGSSNGKIACYENVGTADDPLFESFEYLEADGEEINFYSSVRPSVCDWNEDGYLDILVGNYTGQIFLFLGDGGTGIFSGGLSGDSEVLLRVTGNPASGTLYTEITLDNQVDIRLAVYDLHGRLLYTLNPGVLSSVIHSLKIDISAFSQGTVFLVCTAGDTQLIEPVIILR